jgi:HAD superfamily hydrolase (TIGR01490 family)
VIVERKPLIYFFDMDHTLIDNDCDVSWKQFLVNEGLAPADSMEIADGFYEDYILGKLDSVEFMQFQNAEFVGNNLADMYEISKRHFEVMVKDKIYPSAFELIRQLVIDNANVTLLTATNTVIAAPLAKYLGIELLGTDLVMHEGKFTGEIFEPYCAGEGKVSIAGEYCRENNCSLDDAAYFGDSINDQFLLSEVGFPYVVNPSSDLARMAKGNNWNILQFRMSDNGSHTV